MQLFNITLHNFRRYELAKFHFHPRCTALIGENGKGKTTVLDAIAVMLGTYFQGSGLRTGQSVVRKNDARFVVSEKNDQIYFEPQAEVYLSAEGKIHDHPVHWRRDKGDRGGKAKELVYIGTEDRTLGIRENAMLPIMLYYGVGRLWNVHRNVKTEKPGSQLDAYRFCLDPNSNQQAFEKWFKRLSFSEVQKRREIPALYAVKNAVLSCIPGALNFYYDINEDQIIIELEHDGLVPFNNLSDGYRNMVAMVADIAHRAARLNPHLENNAAKETQGIVLIDEVDLHLHPKWQRSVLGDLQKAFPLLQFIVTTHSPFILQSLGPGEVIDLNCSTLPDDITTVPEQVAAPGPADEYSHRSIEDIVEEVMGVDVPQRSQRHKEMYEVAEKYYGLLQQAAGASTEEKAILKQKLDELSAPFSDNVAYHAFLNMERIAAGLGTSEPQEDV